MKAIRTFIGVAAILSTINFQLATAFAFEGRINAVLTRGDAADEWLYTVGTNYLRVEMTATNWPNPVDILDRASGELTLLFPNNRSFVRLDLATQNPIASSPSLPSMPMPPGVGPQSAPDALPNMPTGMPAMPLPPSEKIELKATDSTTNLLGFTCTRYELKQHGETLEVWATDQLLPYQPYLQSQPRRIGPRRIEEQWPGWLAAKKLFPLLATLKFDHGAERFRFEVQAVTPQKLTDADAKLFVPPAGYFEIQPLPF